MTKKDYVKLADALMISKPPLRRDKVEHLRWMQIVINVADALYADNARFNRDKFYKACGMEDK